MDSGVFLNKRPKGISMNIIGIIGYLNPALHPSSGFSSRHSVTLKYVIT